LQINLTLLEKINPYKGQEDLLSDSLELTHKAITAINQARSAPVQPVAQYSDIVSDGGMDSRNKFGIPAAQRQWVGLTDDEVENIHCTPPRERPRGKFPFARMIEAKLKEKNNA
jgi:hypothetical protein